MLYEAKEIPTLKVYEHLFACKKLKSTTSQTK